MICEKCDQTNQLNVFTNSDTGVKYYICNKCLNELIDKAKKRDANRKIASQHYKYKKAKRW